MSPGRNPNGDRAKLARPFPRWRSVVAPAATGRRPLAGAEFGARTVAAASSWSAAASGQSSWGPRTPSDGHRVGPWSTARVTAAARCGPSGGWGGRGPGRAPAVWPFTAGGVGHQLAPAPDRDLRVVLGATARIRRYARPRSASVGPPTDRSGPRRCGHGQRRSGLLALNREGEPDVGLPVPASRAHGVPALGNPSGAGAPDVTGRCDVAAGCRLLPRQDDTFQRFAQAARPP